jgi:2-hydroxychromene-2-carboxylate isomerase
MPNSGEPSNIQVIGSKHSGSNIAPSQYLRPCTLSHGKSGLRSLAPNTDDQAGQRLSTCSFYLQQRFCLITDDKETIMSSTLEFYFDFGSPTAYLAHKRLGQLSAQYDLQVIYKPMLLGGVFKATGNNSPIVIPAKGQYMMAHDLPRFASRYGVELNPNPFFPINTLNLMRAAIAAERLDCATAFNAAVYDAVWVQEKNMGDSAVVADVLAKHGLDAKALLALSQDPEVKAALITNTEAAVARGIFGTPTFFMGSEMYFGQDRLDFVEESLLA